MNPLEMLWVFVIFNCICDVGESKVVKGISELRGDNRIGFGPDV